MTLTTEVKDFTTQKPGAGKTIGALLLLGSTPPFAMLMWHTISKLDGSFLKLGEAFLDKGPGVLAEAWGPYLFGSPTAWMMLGLYAAFQLACMKLLPGKAYTGTVTPMGNVPQYRNNGLLSYLLSFTFFFGASAGLGWFSPAIIWQHFGELLGALNITALVFCLGLYLKGIYAPSSTDHSKTGNFIFDYYWGTELYPRVLGWDVKMFTNCRIGMTGWALSVMSFAFAQLEIQGSMDPSILVSALLLDIYLLKFFIWEPGYMRSTDIITDRAGFYICWGCLVWVPAVYTSPVAFMVNHPVGMGWGMAAVIFILGNLAIWMNYWADKQRMDARTLQGKLNIWGKPAEVIRARYVTGSGEEKENLLLVSGFWGLARHFHYLPELAAAFFWSCATGFGYLLPFFYVIFLTILLVQRTYRDDAKCAAKYGPAWEEYKRRVRWKMMPGVW